ncbi:hypothetical protein RSA3_02000 [Microbacterium testaceum]|uniref:HTH merR-type domain-containing protein n=1 Tax=Microbacterium testaceum TaxID=2033 RepID=A0A147FBM1_MICTE|nr:hypothetical protein RSA3_02000 [Microbacterium testaceum]
MYSERHVDRIALIQTLRVDFGCSIADIRRLTDQIDRPDARAIDVMQSCQLIATGLRDVEDVDAHRLAQVTQMIREAGWPQIPSIAARALASALEASARAGFVYETDHLVGYARALDPFARRDIENVHPDATLDVLARALLVASAAQTRVFVAMNQLAHTSIAVSRNPSNASG